MKPAHGCSGRTRVGRGMKYFIYVVEETRHVGKQQAQPQMQGGGAAQHAPMLSAGVCPSPPPELKV